jgi:hypothetical protein
VDGRGLALERREDGAAVGAVEHGRGGGNPGGLGLAALHDVDQGLEAFLGVAPGELANLIGRQTRRTPQAGRAAGLAFDPSAAGAGHSRYRWLGRGYHRRIVADGAGAGQGSGLLPGPGWGLAEDRGQGDETRPHQVHVIGGDADQAVEEIPPLLGQGGVEREVLGVRGIDGGQGHAGDLGGEGRGHHGWLGGRRRVA